MHDIVIRGGTIIDGTGRAAFTGDGAISGGRLADQGFEIPPRDRQTPEALGALQKADIEKWWPIIKAANIKGE